MGVTKSEIFTNQQNEIAQIAKVLGHPARVAILQHILKMQACICGDLVEVIGLAQPTISQHLKELKNIGIIQGNIEGTSVCYCINQQRWEEIQQILMSLFSTDFSTETCCN
ncbi:metalloregulator ArsR/SmtB family transcription factor [Tenacibaculum sp. IB213877]|uniref:ArsR/SmtB family transcription factor n=1 Tax=Tenacibaculum sp. IB213877 TaxID=3097351 RepID=UPI002A59F464|nr:metalloregulator ArsR/SmtB family transcription factor [Tenacibaculum sp. IB213877]MDY0781145.1 metalloregulator ArsR/SmtB family transcription factor [Tenacibaculum sp. IB213877]